MLNAAATALVKTLSQGKGATSEVALGPLRDALSVLGFGVEALVAPYLLKDRDEVEHALYRLGGVNRNIYVFEAKEAPKGTWEIWYDSDKQDYVDGIVAKMPNDPTPEFDKLGFGRTVRQNPIRDREILRIQGVWIGGAVIKIKSPKGTTKEFALRVNRPSTRAPYLSATTTEKFKAPGMWKFLYEAGAQELAQTYLNTTEGKVSQDAAERSKSTYRSLDGTGTCQICQRNVKLISGTISRHGWAVQGNRHHNSYGTSFHTSSCPGSGHLPFEQSCATLQRYTTRDLPQYVQSLKDQIEKLDSTQPPLPSGYGQGHMFDSTHRQYPRVLADRKEKLSNQIRQIQQAIVHNGQLISAWKERPLPGT